MAHDNREPREVKNHLLFEVATEVAHRGMGKNTHWYIEKLPG